MTHRVLIYLSIEKNAADFSCDSFTIYIFFQISFLLPCFVSLWIYFVFRSLQDNKLCTSNHLTSIVDRSMLRIKAICLGHKENFTGNYQTIDGLKNAVYEKYHDYLVKKNVKETRINFILTYLNKTTCKEELLEDINIIKKHDGQWFELSVKRVCTIEIET